jgi:hypothetical protein
MAIPSFSRTYTMVISNVSLENRESDMDVIRADYSKMYHSTISIYHGCIASSIQGE